MVWILFVLQLEPGIVEGVMIPVILQDNHNHRLYVQLGFVHQNKLSTLLFCLCLHVQRYSLQTVICCMGSWQKWQPAHVLHGKSPPQGKTFRDCKSRKTHIERRRWLWHPHCTSPITYSDLNVKQYWLMARWKAETFLYCPH